MKKIATLALILICFAALVVVCVRPVRAQYQGDITINADGSVSPSGAPIEQAGNIYALASNINGSITINRNNMVLDGKGSTISVSSVFSGGITLNDVSNVTVEDLTVNGGQFGVNVGGTFNVIANNTITGVNNGIYSLDEPTAGIFLATPSNVITGNNIENCLVGINFAGGSPANCSYNLIVGNTLSECSTALLFYDSSNNTIYYNNFINNQIIMQDTGYSAFDLPSLNIWDNGYPSGGNYWSDYLTRYPNAKMIDDSGIGDTPYFVMPNGFVDTAGMSSSATNYWTKLNAVELNNTDRYPLMSPFDAKGYFYLLRTTPPKISLVSPLEQIYNKSDISLVFTVDKTVNWIGYSLDGQQNVTLSGNGTITAGAVINDTLTNMTNGFHSITVYANDTFGNIGASKNVTFTIALASLERSEPFPTATVAVASGGSAVTVVVAGLLVYFKKHKRQA